MAVCAGVGVVWWRKRRTAGRTRREFISAEGYIQPRQLSRVRSMHGVVSDIYLGKDVDIDINVDMTSTSTSRRVCRGPLWAPRLWIRASGLARFPEGPTVDPYGPLPPLENPFDQCFFDIDIDWGVGSVGVHWWAPRLWARASGLARLRRARPRARVHERGTHSGLLLTPPPLSPVKPEPIDQCVDIDITFVMEILNVFMTYG